MTKVQIQSEAVLMRIAKECDRLLEAPKKMMWVDATLVVLWKEAAPLKIPNVNKEAVENLVTALIQVNLRHKTAARPGGHCRCLIGELGKSYGGALMEWGEILTSDTDLGAL